MPIRRDEDEHNSANATACDTEPVKTEWTKEELEQQGERSRSCLIILR